MLVWVILFLVLKMVLFLILIVMFSEGNFFVNVLKWFCVFLMGVCSERVLVIVVSVFINNIYCFCLV